MTPLPRLHERPAFSVGVKLAAATILIVMVVACALFIALSRYERHSLLAAKERSALMLARLNSDSLAAPVVFGDAEAMKEVITNLARNDEVIYAAVWPLDARAPSGIGPLRAEIRRTEADIKPPSVVSLVARTEVTHDLVLVETAVTDPQGKVVAMAQAAFSLADENAAIRAIERRVLFLSIGVALILTLVLLLLARRIIVRPLARLVVAAKSLEMGQQAVIEVSANDEIGSLARALKAMSAAIANREKRLGERNRDMSLVLDNVEEGFLMIDRNAKMSAERSKILDTWFGAPPSDASFVSYIQAVDANLGALFSLGWEAVEEGFLPLELTIYQLPATFQHEGRFYAMRYRPILAGEEMSSMLVVISDVTERTERERAEVAQRETVAIFRQLMLNRAAFGMFHDEAQSLMSAIESTPPEDRVLIKRQIHTLKGNCSMFGVESVAAACHVIETRMSETDESISPEEKERLRTLWSRVVDSCEQFGQKARGGGVELNETEYTNLVEAVRARIDYRALATLVASWKYESAARRLDRLSEQLQSLATQLGRAAIAVDCAPTALRLPPKRWGPFWSVFAHVMRNSLDHGIETAHDREAAGKPAGGHVGLSVESTGQHVIVSITDDGRGVAWSKLAEKARAQGLPADTEADLVEAMFTDGLSSRDEVTETSGRGVGMGAVRAVVHELGGRIEVTTEAGKGSTFRFVLPGAMLSESQEVVVPMVRNTKKATGT